MKLIMREKGWKLPESTGPSLEEAGVQVRRSEYHMPPPVADGPTLIQAAGNFTRAAAAHQKAGRPKATDEQVAERFAVCSSKSCHPPNDPKKTYFELKGEGAGKCLHPQCGCQLKTVSLEGLAPNKLRWADQACPLGLWKAIAPTTPSTP